MGVRVQVKEGAQNGPRAAGKAYLFELLGQYWHLVLRVELIDLVGRVRSRDRLDAQREIGADRVRLADKLQLRPVVDCFRRRLETAPEVALLVFAALVQPKPLHEVRHHQHVFEHRWLVVVRLERFKRQLVLLVRRQHIFSLDKAPNDGEPM